MSRYYVSPKDALECSVEDGRLCKPDGVAWSEETVNHASPFREAWERLKDKSDGRYWLVREGGHPELWPEDDERLRVYMAELLDKEPSGFFAAFELYDCDQILVVEDDGTRERAMR